MANRYIGRKPVEHRRLLAKRRQQRLRAKRKAILGVTYLPLTYLRLQKP